MVAHDELDAAVGLFFEWLRLRSRSRLSFSKKLSAMGSTDDERR